MLILLLAVFACDKNDRDSPPEIVAEEPDTSGDTDNDEGQDNPDTGDGDQNSGSESFKLPEIDLNNWKVTLPIGNPTEVKPPAILDYATNETLKPFMYNDSINGALVFYTYPGSTTTNTSYSRTELREQMVPGSNSTNWTFPEGGRMKGTVQMDEISKDANDKFHRTMVMQIHGRLTNEQRDLINEDDNNAPPMLKIYWQDGRVRVKTKELKDVNVNDVDILKTSSWTDDDGFYFEERVDYNQFTLEVIASDGRLEVILNENESKVYDGIHMEKWNIFENYFKAGNYLQTIDEGAFARIKYYDLVVSH
ncbi:polysaccharide lyase family 7 protein [Spongiivirga citrea]|uniref:Polysaccharide lyase family 7 protein n=2 Tax=Spongiivirga citrea TaxID=1481457 RepID=A0A6M0CK71_9FLAO|nr:polysaccharide lyase family 7 protein [Spongiivirga citrea]